MYLRRWWVGKYKLPWTHEAAQNATPFELLVELYEDHFDENPREQFDMLRNAESGEIEFEETGDELIDKWEKELALGITPDLSEGLSEDVKKKLAAERQKVQSSRPIAKELDGLVDRYDLEKYVSKSAGRGTPDEARLVGQQRQSLQEVKQLKSVLKNTLGRGR